jgi:hypothetical protein
MLDLLFENAAYIVTEQQWPDFSPSNCQLKMAGVSWLGQCGIVQQYQITQQLERDQVASVMLVTLKGNFFDGQIHLEAGQVEEKEGSKKVVLLAGCASGCPTMRLENEHGGGPNGCLWVGRIHGKVNVSTSPTNSWLTVHWKMIQGGKKLTSFHQTAKFLVHVGGRSALERATRQS